MLLKTLSLFLFLQIIDVNAQVPFTKVAFGKGATQGWLFSPIETDHKKTLVVFLHGYGVSNSKSYGGWIDYLLKNGYSVLFPKYQYGIEPPRSAVYKRRIEELVGIVENTTRGSFDSLFYIGHSIGGVIASNICNDSNPINDIPVKGMLLVSPGHKRFRQDECATYDKLNNSLSLVVVTGKEDNVAKDRFANHVIRTAVELDNKVFLKINEEKDLGTGSKHKEPLSPNSNYSSNKWSIINSIAFKIGTTDAVDEDFYWPLTLKLLKLKKAIGLKDLNELNYPFEVEYPILGHSN